MQPAACLPTVATRPAAQMGSAADFTATMMKHGELMKRPGIYAAFRELLQVRAAGGCCMFFGVGRVV